MTTISKMLRTALPLAGMAFGVAPTVRAADDAAAAAAALCRTVDDGTACDAIDGGVREPGYGLRWQRVAGAGDWQTAAEKCQALGSGWRLPKLAELDAAYQRTAFGYCSFSAWSAQSDDSGKTAWQRGVTYEGEPKCTTAADGSSGCIGGCGPMAMVRQPAPATQALAIVCVNDQGG